MEEKDKIAECYKKMYQGMIAKDRAMLEQVLDEAIQIDLHGNSGTLLGQSRVSAAVFGGGRHTWRLQLKSTLIKRESRWYIGKTTASTY